MLQVAWTTTLANNLDAHWIDGSAELSNVVDASTTALLSNGFALLRGISDSKDAKAIAARLTALSERLGTIVPQSPRGELVEDVRDFSDVDAEDKRGYRSRGALTPHSDPPTLIVLHCLQPARSGGESYFVNVRSIHDRIEAMNPALLAELYRENFPIWRVEGAHGIAEAGPYERRRPIFCMHDGRVSCIYYRPFIELAANVLGTPMTAQQQAALDAFDACSTADDLAWRVTLQAGETAILHNRCVLHARTDYEDWPEQDKRRHLLRLWIDAPERFPVDSRHELGDMFSPVSW
ncbi:MAG: TauD/TfdA family dioxygenase [Pseudomonadota bacterium]